VSSFQGLGQQPACNVSADRSATSTAADAAITRADRGPHARGQAARYVAQIASAALIVEPRRRSGLLDSRELQLDAHTVRDQTMGHA
jgi:hypothetical protein